MVETDKANLPVESASSGTLLKIGAAPGEIMQVGDVVGYIGRPGEVVPDQPGETGHGSEVERREAGVGSQKTGVRSDGAQGSAIRPPAPGKVLASPAARQLARDSGVDLSGIHGSGPGGRIEIGDVASQGTGAQNEERAISTKDGNDSC